MFRRDNASIDGVLKWSKDFSERYFKERGCEEMMADDKKIANLTAFTDRIIDKIAAWLKAADGRKTEK